MGLTLSSELCLAKPSLIALILLPQSLSPLRSARKARSPGCLSGLDAAMSLLCCAGLMSLSRKACWRAVANAIPPTYPPGTARTLTAIADATQDLAAKAFPSWPGSQGNGPPFVSGPRPKHHACSVLLATASAFVLRAFCRTSGYLIFPQAGSRVNLARLAAFPPATARISSRPFWSP